MSARIIPRLCAIAALLAAPVVASPAISLVPLPSATVNTPYQTTLSTWTSGGTAPYFYSAAVLPPGLTLANSTGLITGTPTTPFPDGFAGSVTVTDSSSSPQIVPLSITVFTQPLTVITTALPAGNRGLSYSQPIQVVGGVPPYSFALLQSSLAGTGVSLDPGTGIVSGTPLSTGLITFRVKVTDQHGSQVGQTITLQINAPPPLSITTPAPIDVAAGGSFSVNISVSGGVPPYTFTPAGTFPQGFSLSSSGTLSGNNLQPGNIGVTVTATDSQPVNISTGIQVNVLGFATASPLPPGTTVSPYSASIAATGGVPPYSYTASGLPSTLSLSAAGNLTGAVAKAGTINFNVQVTDKGGVTASSPYSLTISVPNALSMSAPSLANGTVNVHYSGTVASSASGGNPPYQWALDGGALPPGLSLSASGVISGTPTVYGSYSFTVEATDGSGATGTAPVTLQINPPPLTITTASPLPSGIVGSVYPQQILGAAGGVGPYTFAITAGALPNGLNLTNGVIQGTPTTASGSPFSVTITAQDSVGTTPAQATLSLSVRAAVAAAPDLLVSAGALSFALSTGANSLPGSQSVSITSSDVTQILSFSIEASQANSGPAWFTASVGSANPATPATLTVALTSQALSLPASPNPYMGTIALSCASGSPCANATPQTVAVALTVTTSPGILNVTTNLLSFSTTASAAAASSQPIVIQNSGGASLGFASVACEASWCTVVDFPSPIYSGATESIYITADPTGLPAGYYRTTVDIASSGGSASVPVTLLISESSELLLAPSGVQIQMLSGGTPGNPNGSFLVSLAGTATVSWTAAILPPSSPQPNWLILNTTGGSASGAAPGTVNFSIDPNVAATLTAGPYYATIQVTSAGAANSPQNFEVVLNVAPATTTGNPYPSPAGLVFLAEAGSAPPPQTVQVFSSAPSIGYQASTNTNDGAAWLTVAPLKGTTSSSSAALTQVSVDPSVLSSPGIYYGGVNYSLSNSGVQTVNVMLIVEAPVAAPSAVSAHGSVHSDATTPACTPSTLAPAQTGLLNNFSAPASWPTPLAILLLNDCGNAVPSGQVVVTFTNGDPPLALGLADSTKGLYSGTWTPRNTGSQVSLNAQATAPGLRAAAVQITGSVVPNIAPVLATKGTLHVFNPQLGAAMAPGTIVQIYGSGLASGIASASTIPLPTSLNGTSVIVGGIPAPLYFVSPGQINAQLPYQLDPNGQYQVIAVANGALSTPNTIQLAPATPGFAAFASGGLIAQHFLDGSLITASSPAQPGEIVVAYLAGMGDTNVPVQAGVGAPSGPLAYAAVTPTLTLNGTQVSILYAGLCPGLVGLYQLDFQIPADTPDGTLNVVLTQNAFGSNTTTLPVQQQ